MQQKPQIAGILFDKDGTLLDFDASWGPVNREVALMAADAPCLRHGSRERRNRARQPVCGRQYA